MLLGIGKLGAGFGRAGAASIGGGDVVVTFDPDAEILFTAMTPPPDQARKIVIDTLIVALKAAGVWQALDVFWIFAAHAQQPATLNWKSPARFTTTPVQSPPFTVDRGFTGNGSSYLAPGWAAVVDGVQFQQDSAHISGWSLTAGRVSSTDVLVGTASGVPPSLTLIPCDASGLTAVMVNDGSRSTTMGNAFSDGFFIANRSAADARQAFRSGIVLDQDAELSTGISGGGLTFLRDAAVFSTLQIAEASVGCALTEPQAQAFYDALLGYMQSVGAQP